MVDQTPEFETQDLKGSTDSYSGTVGTSFVAIPTSSGNRIQEFFVVCQLDQSSSARLSVSIDGGTTVCVLLAPGGYFSGPLKGDKKQIHIKGNSSSVGYRVVINREDNV